MTNSYKKMRIGIDARFFGPRQKGLGRYVQKLVEGLEQSDGRNEYVIFLRKENWQDFQPQNHNFHKVLADCRWYTFKEQLFMPYKIYQQKIDLMHYPHFNICIFSRVPFVVTIHDLVLKRFPTKKASTLGAVRYYMKNLFYSFVIWWAVQKSAKIIAVSEHTKEDILQYFHVRPEKIKVIYEGSPQPRKSFLVPIANLPHKISKPYLLYVGNAYPHKNLERLIMAYVKLISSDKNKYQNLQLVLVGEMDYFYQRLKKMAYFYWPQIRDRIIFTGLVKDQELVILYQNAHLYIFPSLCEGFGLPPLEAMAYGCPVVSSNATCLKEILGSAAVYFNGYDIDNIVQKIVHVLNDLKIRKRLINSGYERISRYSWPKMAEQTKAQYLELMS